MKTNFAKVMGDVALNSISAVMPIAILQIVILPAMGRYLGENPYGLVLALVSLISLIALPLGNALNNTRLLKNIDYSENSLQGDFNIILLCSFMLNILLVALGCLYYLHGGAPLDTLLVVAIACLNLLREYFVVAFRLELNYKAILLNNTYLCVGYLVGLILFLYFIPCWQLIYLCGGALSLLYVINRQTLHREPLRLTDLFRDTLKMDAILVFTSFLGTIASYADKLVILPLLGSAAVSVYFSASIFSKIISITVTPISGVLLSYLPKIKCFSTKNLFMLVLVTTVFGLIGTVVCIWMSGPVLRCLYPGWAERSMELVPMLTLSGVFLAISSIVNPFVLRFCKISLQILISAVDAILYLVCAYMFYSYLGLVGFCYGVLVSSILRVVIKCVIYWRKASRSV